MGVNSVIWLLCGRLLLRAYRRSKSIRCSVKKKLLPYFTCTNTLDSFFSTNPAVKHWKVFLNVWFPLCKHIPLPITHLLLVKTNGTFKGNVSLKPQSQDLRVTNCENTGYAVIFSVQALGYTWKQEGHERTLNAQHWKQYKAYFLPTPVSLTACLNILERTFH